MSSIVLLSGLFMLILTWYVIVLTEGMVFVERAADGGSEPQGRRFVNLVANRFGIRRVVSHVIWTCFIPHHVSHRQTMSIKMVTHKSSNMISIIGLFFHA